MSTARCNFYQYYDNTAEPLPKDFGLRQDAVVQGNPGRPQFPIQGTQAFDFF